MATLRLRNGVWYLDYRYKGRRHQKSTKTADRKLAEAKLNELKVKIFKDEMGVEVRPSGDDHLGGFFRRFMNHVAENYALDGKVPQQGAC